MGRNPSRRGPGAGVSDPFVELYRRSFGRVWGVLGRLGVERREEREDLAQDVFVIAHEKRLTRDPAAPELAWLFTIARNVARNSRALLRDQMEKPMDDPDTLLELASPEPTTEEVVARRRTYLAIMESLSSERREVFEMHEVDGFSAPEIAAALGIPEGTVNTRLRDAREDVRAAAARMKAQDKRGAASMILPFGVGAWHSVRDLFGDVPAGVEDGVWRAVHRALVRGAMLGAAGASGTAGALAAGNTAGAVAIGKAALGAILAGAFALGGVTGGAAVYVRQGSVSKPPAVAVLPETQRSVAVAAGDTVRAPEERVEPVTSATAASVEAVGPRAAASARATVTAAASQIDPEEMALIGRAQVAFARKDRAGTIEALDAHARKFPKGKLSPERESIRASLREAAGSWGGDSSLTPGVRDAGRGRVFGTDD